MKYFGLEWYRWLIVVVLVAAWPALVWVYFRWQRPKDEDRDRKRARGPRRTR